MRPKAIEVIPHDDYCLIITFNNSEKKLFDVKPYFTHKAFAELKNPVLFKTVKTAGLSVEWVHGQDICPDDLYYNSVSI